MTLTERRRVAGEILAESIGWNVAIGATLLLLGVVAFDHLVTMTRAAIGPMHAHPRNPPPWPNRKHAPA